MSTSFIRAQLHARIARKETGRYEGAENKKARYESSENPLWCQVHVEPANNKDRQEISSTLEWCYEELVKQCV